MAASRKHVAHTTASDITQIYNSDSDAEANAANTAALTALFEISFDMIATRATDTLYTATHSEQNTDAQDEAEDIEQDNADGAPAEDSVAPVAAFDIDALTDPEDTVPVSYLHVLANAQ